MKHLPSDTKTDTDYKNLLSNQLSWCNSNREAIIRQATNLYRNIIQGKARPELLSRCCKFKVNEHQYKAYCDAHNLPINEEK